MSENKKSVIADIKFVPKHLMEYDEKKKEFTEKAIFRGFLLIRPPTMRERMKIIKKCNLQINEQGEMVEAGVNANIDTMVQIIDETVPFISRVELKHTDGTVFKSYEELESDTRTDSILKEVAFAIMAGFTLSKNSNPA